MIAWVDTYIAQSGHKELEQFGNLWPYSYVQDYKYTKDNKLTWIQETGTNTETVLAIKFSTLGTWDDGHYYYAVQINLYGGIRGNDKSNDLNKSSNYTLTSKGDGTTTPVVTKDRFKLNTTAKTLPIANGTPFSRKENMKGAAFKIIKLTDNEMTLAWQLNVGERNIWMFKTKGYTYPAP